MNDGSGQRRAWARARMTLFMTLALAVGAASGLIGASAALAVGTGSIAGTVVDDSDQTPIAGIRVCAEKVGGFESGICDLTEADGGYAIAALSTGSYKVGFSVPFASDANYVAEYYDDEPSGFEADPVAVAEGAARSGIDAALHAGGRIAGEVVAAAGGAPLESIEVCAFHPGGAEELAGCVETDGDGEYAIASLPSGSYKVRFAPGFGEISAGEFGRLNYVTQYYSGKTKAQADVVTTTAGLTTLGIDAAMAVGGTVSGLVTAVGGDPIEGVQVCPYQGGEAGQMSCDFTDGDGEYSISGLATGSYKVGFVPGYGDQVHARRYYDDKATLAAANPVPVTQGGAVAGIDAELPELGGIAGRVTAVSGGAPLAGIEVCAASSGSENPDYGCDATDASGDYAIPGLQEGSYRVAFQGGSDYVTEYYDGKSSNFNATPVAVVNATVTGSIDAALQTAGKVSGKVVDATGKAALQDIEVCAQKPSGAPGAGACAVTGADGKYAIGGLAAGSYAVRFSVPYFKIANYLTQYYSGRAREGEADLVTVAAGATTTSIDAEMHAGGAIEGRAVGASGGAALEGVEVCATPVSTRRNAFGNCDSTDADGGYRIERLPTGPYKVRFSPGFSLRGYVARYYDGAATKKLASPVAVTAGAAVGGIDAELQKGGRIEGTVVDAVSDSPLQGINVCLRNNFEACVATGADGTYAIEGLAAGSYRIGFFSGTQTRGYLDQYYDGKASRDAADPVAVSLGATVARVDAEMQRGGTIAGEVTDALSHDGVDAVQACAYAATSGEYEACANTDSDGTYAIEGLPTGSYKIKFYPGNEFGGGPGAPSPNFNYVAQYYDGEGSRDTAVAVAVTAGETVPEVDAAMEEGGQIEGRVVDALTKVPNPYTAACVYDPDEGEYSHCGYTDADGEYRIEGLATGSYKVRFWPNSGFGENDGGYLPQFYDDQAGEGAATPVAVTASSAHTGIDAELHAGGRIEGRVTDAADGVPLAFVFVCALEAGGAEEPLSCAETEGNGRYAIAGLASGSYKVSFEALSYEESLEETVAEEEFTTQYYDSAGSRANAKLVAVTAGGPAVTAIDAAMVEPGGAGPGGNPGGGSPGGGGPGVLPPAPVPPAPPSRSIEPKPKPRICKKGLQKKRVHGKVKCVKKKPKKPAGKRR